MDTVQDFMDLCLKLRYFFVTAFFLLELSNHKVKSDHVKFT